jgi:bacteriochlorophyllide a dehydrogenase
MAKNLETSVVIFPEPYRITVERFKLPQLTDTDVLIEIEYSSISVGTELWCLTGQLMLSETEPLKFPHAAGYQVAGIIREIGKKVQGLKPGDRVFNRKCRKPDGWIGSWWAGHSGFHVANHQNVIKLADGISTYDASSLLIAQVGFNGATKPCVSKGDKAVVIGAGLVGQYAGQVLRFRGAHVIMADIVKSKLNKAIQYSADEVFDCSENDLVGFIRNKYPDGVDIVLETASSSKTISMAIEMLKPGGQLVLNGFYRADEGRLEWQQLRSKEITIYCPNSATPSRLKKTADLIEEGHIKVGELITDEFGFSRAPEVYKMILDKSTDFLGIVFNWQH